MQGEEVGWKSELALKSAEDSKVDESHSPADEPKQPVPPITAHSGVFGQQTCSSDDYDEDVLDLVDCEEVSIEVRHDDPGLKYKRNSDKEGWTRVERRKGKRCQTFGGKEHSCSFPPKCNDEYSGNELDVAGARQVKYEERDDVPGLYIRRGNTPSRVTWTPIKPSPFTSRLRTKTKIKYFSIVS